MIVSVCLLHVLIQIFGVGEINGFFRLADFVNVLASWRLFWF